MQQAADSSGNGGDRTKTGSRSACSTVEQIPVEVLREHNGKWIAWDEESRSVLGVGDTFEAAEREAEQKKPAHLLRFHHANWLNGIAARVNKP
jgi:hypothetical protein